MGVRSIKRNYTYMLRCSDGSLYTGWTNDIDKRLDSHNKGKGAKYTRNKGPVELVYLESFDDKESAMSREAKIKKFSKLKKEELIDSRVNILKNKY
ncbi:MAG: GIY-YIG nuclease family protein [Hornefia sp.]|nr:GIY-YIG nuclease family protein [Hornefia sp.]